ncbi:endonuclease/exonuclease/phosphatase family protein [Gracilimonas mengyeensis]|uniref:Metal-dependent hydrolase, endonuclease/exonuclease/phosphatase family n=1 Tax=Gracilimonas mengyeensis TaxID=1302730 RepID=A0A521C0V7_9BACT|nr:endonuclease/exonuclease/phosphatase family protein [Gracilimonas mengyeensis]SMO53034.1 Metal-dependent hydrolase, endonuclease/exonuclease/phosphatase family [Gracilimonas mengyeensis]
MKYLLSLLALLLFTTGTYGQSYSAATYNIRVSMQSDGGDYWEFRRQRVANQLARLTLDIFGTQEGLEEQIRYLDQKFPDFSYVGVGRDDGEISGEYTAIFYDDTRFNKEKSGTFWLSDTPDEVSTGWDAALPRICTYVLLRDESNDQHLWVFNTHLDHQGEEARLESLKLIHQKIEQLNTADYPVILMGDLNALPDSEPISYLSEKMNDARSITQSEPEGPLGTFNGFDISNPLDRRIDYIFVSDEVQVDNYAVDHEISYSRTPSDHLPVIIEFSISSGK